jgi:hypothetical protein
MFRGSKLLAGAHSADRIHTACAEEPRYRRLQVRSIRKCVLGSRRGSAPRACPFGNQWAAPNVWIEKQPRSN